MKAINAGVANLLKKLHMPPWKRSDFPGTQCNRHNKACVTVEVAPLYNDIRTARYNAITNKSNNMATKKKKVCHEWRIFIFWNKHIATTSTQWFDFNTWDTIVIKHLNINAGPSMFWLSFYFINQTICKAMEAHLEDEFELKGILSQTLHWHTSN